MDLFLFSGYRAGSKEASDSLSTVSVTSTWFWWPTWRVQGISWMCGSRAPRLIGWAWAVTGDRTGNPTPFSWASRFLSGLEAAMAAPLLLRTWHHLIGSLVRPSRAKTSASELTSPLFFSFLFLSYLLVFTYQYCNVSFPAFSFP